jgi:hypothetical protein
VEFAGEGRTDGNQPSAGRVGAGNDVARHRGKSNGILRKGPEVKYAVIQRHEQVWPIRVQGCVLGVGISSYYEHLARRRSMQAVEMTVCGKPENAPSSAEYRYNLGFVLERRGDLAGAVATFQKSAELGQSKDVRCLAALADAYDKTGQFAEAIRAARGATDLAVLGHDQQREQSLRDALDRYGRDGAQSPP